MAKVTIRPVADVDVTWTATPGSAPSHASCIDAGVTSEGSQTKFVTAVDNGTPETVRLASLPNSLKITSRITLYVLVNSHPTLIGPTLLQAQLYVAGVAKSAVSIPLKASLNLDEYFVYTATATDWIAETDQTLDIDFQQFAPTVFGAPQDAISIAGAELRLVYSPLPGVYDSLDGAVEVEYTPIVPYEVA